MRVACTLVGGPGTHVSAQCGTRATRAGKAPLVPHRADMCVGARYPEPLVRAARRRLMQVHAVRDERVSMVQYSSHSGRKGASFCTTVAITRLYR